MSDENDNASPASLRQPSAEAEANTMLGGVIATSSPKISYPFDPASDVYVGQQFDGRYEIIRVLGEGGMGVVYAARHIVIDKRVAVKILRGEMAHNKEITDRFLQEARAASSIGSPHIIDISDFGVLPDGATYFVMEFLDGVSLSEAINDQRPFPIARLVNIAKQIALGLSAAHSAGIVHRDMKPDNVMLVTRGPIKDFVKILDFGIAKVGGMTSKLTQAGSIFGTPHYMSPEQAAGVAVDHRTDVYALGVMLYEMAAGTVPFDADNFMGILTQHMYKAPVPLRVRLPAAEVPPGLEAIVMKCLTKMPEGRYATMDALLEDMAKFEAGGVPDAVKDLMNRSGGFNVPSDYFRSSSMPLPMPASPHSGMLSKARWPWLAAIVSSVMLLGIVIGIVTRRESPPPSQDSSKPTAAASSASSLPAVNPMPPPALTASTTLVIVSVEPFDAKVTRDGVELDGIPVTLNLTQGEKATLQITRDGYKSQKLVIDESQPKRVVKLLPIPHPNGHSTSPSTETRSNQASSPDLADPWK